MALNDRTAQSWRTLAGQAFEGVVSEILNSTVTEEGLFVVKGTSDALQGLINDSPTVQRIIDYNRLPVKRPCDQSQLQDYPDTDLFVLFKDNGAWKVLGIVSCKVSLHGRHTETCFWGTLIRLTSNIKYVFVTEDRDIYQGKPSELGRSCEEPRAARRLLESFTNRVYLVKQYSGPLDPNLARDVQAFRSALDNDSIPLYAPYDTATTPFFDDLSPPTHTQYCSTVRPIDDLVFDLVRWRRELAP